VPVTAPPVHELTLPYASPPLSLNHRHSRWAEAKLVKQLRRDAWVMARHARIGPYERVAVTLHWQPARRGTYDQENPTPTLKACADGLVDAGVLGGGDDTYDRMTKTVQIHPPRRPGRLWLTVVELTCEHA
jgi:crossover junction endodeoxyribonuclease RusA